MREIQIFYTPAQSLLTVLAEKTRAPAVRFCRVADISAYIVPSCSSSFQIRSIIYMSVIGLLRGKTSVNTYDVTGFI